MGDWEVLALMFGAVSVLCWAMLFVRRARHHAELRAWSQHYPRSGPQGPPRVVP